MKYKQALIVIHGRAFERLETKMQEGKKRGNNMFLTHNNRCLEFLNNMFYSNGLRQIQKRSLNCFPHLKRRKEQKNIQDTFWSQSVFSLFYLSLFNLDLLVLHVLS